MQTVRERLPGGKGKLRKLLLVSPTIIMPPCGLPAGGIFLMVIANNLNPPARGSKIHLLSLEHFFMIASVAV